LQRGTKFVIGLTIQIFYYVAIYERELIANVYRRIKVWSNELASQMQVGRDSLEAVDQEVLAIVLFDDEDWGDRHFK
jgi:hypothetical protein